MADKYHKPTGSTFTQVTRLIPPGYVKEPLAPEKRIHNTYPDTEMIDLEIKEEVLIGLLAFVLAMEAFIASFRFRIYDRIAGLQKKDLVEKQKLLWHRRWLRRVEYPLGASGFLFSIAILLGYWAKYGFFASNNTSPVWIQQLTRGIPLWVQRMQDLAFILLILSIWILYCYILLYWINWPDRLYRKKPEAKHASSFLGEIIYLSLLAGLMRLFSPIVRRNHLLKGEDD